MKNHPDNLDDPSRRLFAKSATAALVAAPLAAALAGCRQQTPKPVSPQDSPSHETGSPPCETAADVEFKKCHCEEGEGGGITHEPPIIIGGGSLRLDTFRNIRLDTTVAGDPRPNKYGLASGAYKTIAVVGVMTEANDGKVKFDNYSFTALAGCKVLIWLEQLKTDTPGTIDEETEYDATTAAPGKEPHLLITGDPFLIEVDKPLQNRVASNKGNRPHRWTHPGFSNKHFHIGRWEIRNKRDQILDSGSGGDNYVIAILFRD